MDDTVSLTEHLRTLICDHTMLDKRTATHRAFDDTKGNMQAHIFLAHCGLRVFTCNILTLAALSASPYKPVRLGCLIGHH
jgi:hypothetical protein